MNTYLYSTDTATQSIFLFLTIGVIFFVVTTLTMIFMFGWSIKDAGRHAHTFVVLLLISLGVPYGTYYIQQYSTSAQATRQVQVHQLEVNDVGQDMKLIQFKTDVGSIIYIETKDSQTGEIMPVLPTNGVEKQLQHSFIIPRPDHPVEIIIIINGKKYLIDNKPYFIGQ
ncbi:hypothetical protein BH09PAT2_BH09PAT2_06840 [soil metagenome]